jgi:hypothetical protein
MIVAGWVVHIIYFVTVAYSPPAVKVMKIVWATYFSCGYFILCVGFVVYGRRIGGLLPAELSKKVARVSNKKDEATYLILIIPL